MDLVEADVSHIKTGAKKNKPLMGVTKPRLMTPALKGKSRGDEFAEFAEKCGYPLMPWQKYVSSDFLTYGNDGKYIKKLISLTISRQNGKTYLMAMRILFGLFVGGEKSIVAISSKRGMAEDTFNKVCNIVEQNAFLRNEAILVRGRVGYRGNGKQHLDLRNGARYEVCAATADGTRGKSADLLVCDELASISVEAWDSAKPVTIARPNSQVLVASNAGTAYSTVLNLLREIAMSYPPVSMGWYEYSAPQHCKPLDPHALAQANPALGTTITLEAIENAYATMDATAFLREHLCQWVSSTQSPWPLGSWEALSDITLSLPPGPLTYFAFDKSKQGAASLMAGQLMPDGKIGVGLLEHWKPDQNADDLTIAATIKKWADLYRPVMVCFDNYATATIAARLTASNLRCVDVSGKHFYQASGDLLDCIVSNRLVHQGQVELNEMMAACASKVNDAAWRIVRRASAGDVSGPIALAMIVHKMNEPVSIPKIMAV